MIMPGWLGDGDYGTARTRAGDSPANYARLAALKARYDPDNRFRLLHNIPPADDLDSKRTLSAGGQRRCPRTGASQDSAGSAGRLLSGGCRRWRGASPGGLSATQGRRLSRQG